MYVKRQAAPSAVEVIPDRNGMNRRVGILASFVTARPPDEQPSVTSAGQ